MKRQPDFSVLILFAALLFGGLVRFLPALMTRFPINDGGMFYTMARELSANGYALPATTSYNGLSIPFAYPPLGLYLASLLADLARVPLLGVFLWLPPFFSLLAIPAFYLLARALLADKLRASLAALFFALAPGSYDWHVMGGGVTRSAGMLFLLLAAFFVFRLFQQGDRRLVLPAILFSSLAVLSHPEVGLQTAGLCLLFWLSLDRTPRGLLHAFLLAFGVFLLSAPWWGTVLAQHGLSPFLSALHTGQHSSAAWGALLVGFFVGDEIVPLLLFLRLAGFIYAVWKRQFLLTALVLFPLFVDPRSAVAIAHIALSMLAALGFLDALPALLRKIRGAADWLPRAATPVLAALAFTLFIECGLHDFKLVNTTLTADSRAAMTWLRGNLPPGRDFLLLTGWPYSMSDPVQEWFPALAGQHSQTTLQGLEWTLGAGFNARLSDLVELQSCASAACVDAWSARTGLGYDYLWVTKTIPSLEQDLRASSDYRAVFQSETVAVFQRVTK